MPFHRINANRSLGAVLIGLVVAAILFGITSFQAFHFFSNNRKDSRTFRGLIGLLWALDAIHIAFLLHGTYWYLVSNFSHFEVLVKPPWSLLAQIVVTCISDFLVRCIFARRIWLLSGQNNTLLAAIILTSAFVLSTGLAFALRGFADKTYMRIMRRESWLLYSALGGDVVGDVLVTGSLCALLRQSRSGFFKSTDSLVNVLMFYTINTGLLTSICATACFVTYTIWPREFIAMGVYFVLSKLYLNSLLGLLNTRENLRQRKTAIESAPQSPSDVDVLHLTEIILDGPKTPVGSRPPDTQRPQ